MRETSHSLAVGAADANHGHRRWGNLSLVKQKAATNGFRKKRLRRVYVSLPNSEVKECEVISTMSLMSLDITTRWSKASRSAPFCICLDSNPKAVKPSWEH